jgi:shikimate kinase
MAGVRKIFLVGFMGSGKSSFGRRLAGQIDWDFIDSDREIELRAGMEISAIFAEKGEAWFREIESQVVQEAVLANRNIVVALGGGAVCRNGTMELLRGAGVVVYLKMPPAQLVRRMGEGGRARRPKIAGMNDAKLLDYIEKTLPERENWYNKATFVVDCGALSDEAVLGVLAEIANGSRQKI